MSKSAHIANEVGFVTVDQLFKHLRTHRVRWPAQMIAEKAGLPRSIVYDALAGKNITLKTLRAIAKVCNAEVVLVMKRGKSKLAT